MPRPRWTHLYCVRGRTFRDRHRQRSPEGQDGKGNTPGAWGCRDFPRPPPRHLLARGARCTRDHHPRGTRQPQPRPRVQAGARTLWRTEAGRRASLGPQVLSAQGARLRGARVRVSEPVLSPGVRSLPVVAFAACGKRGIPASPA